MLHQPTEQWVPAAVIISLPGVPRGKGRPRFVRATGGTYTDEQTRTYENDLKAAAAVQMVERPPMTGPVRVQVEAHMPIPASWSKKKKAEALANHIRPTVKPDADNLIKMLDALNEVVFRDDKQIIRAEIEKRYSDRPRLVVRVWKM